MLGNPEIGGEWATILDKFPATGNLGLDPPDHHYTPTPTRQIEVCAPENVKQPFLARIDLVGSSVEGCKPFRKEFLAHATQTARLVVAGSEHLDRSLERFVAGSP